MSLEKYRLRSLYDKHLTEEQLTNEKLKDEIKKVKEIKGESKKKVEVLKVKTHGKQK